MNFTEAYELTKTAAAIAITAQELMKGDETFRELFDAQQCILQRIAEKLDALANAEKLDAFSKKPAPAAAPQRYARHSDPDRIRRTVRRSPAAGEHRRQLLELIQRAQAERGRAE